MNPDLVQIAAPQEAESIADAWARSNDGDAARARAFARRWFDAVNLDNRTPVCLKFMLNSFERDRTSRLKALKEAIELIRPMAVDWALEVSKHLATFNGAGFAGAAAMLATKYADSPLTKTALVLFACGFLLAILNMWFNTQYLGRALKDAGYALRVTEDACSWEDFHNNPPDDRSLSSGDWTALAVRVGWASAVAGLAAATMLGVAVF